MSAIGYMAALSSILPTHEGTFRESATLTLFRVVNAILHGALAVLTRCKFMRPTVTDRINSVHCAAGRLKLLVGGENERLKPQATRRVREGHFGFKDRGNDGRFGTASR
jgi:hypothetical protein